MSAAAARGSGAAALRAAIRGMRGAGSSAEMHAALDQVLDALEEREAILALTTDRRVVLVAHVSGRGDGVLLDTPEAFLELAADLAREVPA